MKNAFNRIGTLLIVAAMSAAASPAATAADFVKDNAEHAARQYRGHLHVIDSVGHFINPRTVNPDGTVWYVPVDDWCSGFPGKPVVSRSPDRRRGLEPARRPIHRDS